MRILNKWISLTLCVVCISQKLSGLCALCMGKSRDSRVGKIRVQNSVLPLINTRLWVSVLNFVEFLHQGTLLRMHYLVFSPYPETAILRNALMLLTPKRSPVVSTLARWKLLTQAPALLTHLTSMVHVSFSMSHQLNHLEITGESHSHTASTSEVTFLSPGHTLE